MPYLIPFHWSREAQNSFCFCSSSSGRPPLALFCFNGNYNGKTAKNLSTAIKSSGSVLQPSSTIQWVLPLKNFTLKIFGCGSFYKKMQIFTNFCFNGNYNGKKAKNLFTAIKSSRSVLQRSSLHFIFNEQALGKIARRTPGFL